MVQAAAVAPVVEAAPTAVQGEARVVEGTVVAAPEVVVPQVVVRPVVAEGRVEAEVPAAGATAVVVAAAAEPEEAVAVAGPVAEEGAATHAVEALAGKLAAFSQTGKGSTPAGVEPFPVGDCADLYFNAAL